MFKRITALAAVTAIAILSAGCESSEKDDGEMKATRPQSDRHEVYGVERTKTYEDGPRRFPEFR